MVFGAELARASFCETARRRGCSSLLLLAFAGSARALYESDLCPSESGAWLTEPASQFSWNSSCEMHAVWDTENRNYAWLDPGTCCDTAGGWADVRVTAVVRATRMPSASKGRIELIARDAAGPSAECDGNDPSEGYAFGLDIAHGETSLERRAGCDSKHGLVDPAAAAYLAVDVSYTLTAVLNGSSLSMFVDGALVHTVEDTAWATAGSVGLYCFRIDCALEHLSVEALDGDAAALGDETPTPLPTPVIGIDPGPTPLPTPVEALDGDAAALGDETPTPTPLPTPVIRIDPGPPPMLEIDPGPLPVIIGMVVAAVIAIVIVLVFSWQRRWSKCVEGTGEPPIAIARVVGEALEKSAPFGSERQREPSATATAVAVVRPEEAAMV